MPFLGPVGKAPETLPSSLRGSLLSDRLGK